MFSGGEHSRSRAFFLAVMLLSGAGAVAAAACGFVIDGLGESATPGSTNDDGGTTDGGGSVGSNADGSMADAGPPVCDWPSLEKDAVWPMLGGCVDHAGRTVFQGPHVLPEVIFSAPLKTIFFAIPIAGADGTVFVNADVSGIVAVQPTDGGTFVRVDAGPQSTNITNAPAIAANGTLFFGAGEYIASSWPRDPTTRNRVFDTNGEVDTSVALTRDGTVIAGSFSDFLYALDPNDGGKRWEIDLNSDVKAAPAVSKTGVIYTCAGNHCFAIRDDGQLEWDYDARGDVSLSAPVLTNDGTILIMPAGGELRALRPDKSEKWMFRTNSAGPSLIQLCAAVGFDGTIYTTMNNQVVALNPDDGIPRWQADVGGAIRTSILIDRTGVLYVGTNNGFVVAVNPNGTILWTLKLQAGNPENFVIGRDGTLFVATTNINALLALR